MSAMRFFRTVPELMLTLLLTVAAAAAQEGPRAGNPHGNLNLDCNLCHSEGAGLGEEVSGEFDHDLTGFPLEGRHAQARCRDCHHDPNFAFVGTACADCHADLHKGRLGNDCARCHTPTDWVDRSDERRRHDATGFPLVGVHDRVDCDACHGGPLAGDYAGTPTDCYFCHAASYEATTNPDHRAAGFGNDCATCHSPYSSTFGSGDFVHPASFPLTEGHRSLQCADCHTGGFDGTVSDCYFCHGEDYEGTTDPDHVSAGFPTSCSICHSTVSFAPAQYTHNTTGFPLTGAHGTLDCLACHENGYAGTPSDCYACHQAEYQATTDPNHQSSGFPTGCTDCHTTTAWTPADWDHDSLFPIYSGNHRGEWNSCTDCHTVPANYAVFECIFCHEHGQSETDSRHRDVRDYQYLSTACYQCHPRGSGD